METKLCEALETLRSMLPRIFPGNKLDELTCELIRWRTVQNEIWRGEVPDEAIFRYGGSKEGRNGKIGIIRDPFLRYEQTKFTNVRIQTSPDLSELPNSRPATPNDGKDLGDL